MPTPLTLRSNEPTRRFARIITTRPSQDSKRPSPWPPTRASIRKDLAYTLVKIGENEAARDQFAEAMRIDPADEHVALEYAFLCYETKQQAIARRIFDRIRKAGNATAEQAFQNIDQPLAEGIARWKKALELSPDNFSAHQELATLAEQRDELQLAADQYLAAWRLRPQERSLMLDLGRVWKALGRVEHANSIFLAASRGAQARVAEKAREFLPARYPYAYEFEKALELDPGNFELRREYAYLLLQLSRQADAERQFLILHQAAPDDLLMSAQLGFLKLNRGDREGALPLLEQVLKGNDPVLADRVREALKLPHTGTGNGASSQPASSEDSKALADKSMKAGYMKDALKYLTLAHDQDPSDYGVMLKLGWLYNILHDDREAIKWFDLASKSPDASVSQEAEQAYKNLAPEFARFRTTVWMFPMFSTRWHDLFGYGQVKTEIKLGHLPIHPYLSTRFIGDARGSCVVAAKRPASAIPLGELLYFWRGRRYQSHPRHHRMVRGRHRSLVILITRNDVGAAIPDYRGGVSYAKGFGHLSECFQGSVLRNQRGRRFCQPFPERPDVLHAEPCRLHFCANGKAWEVSSPAVLERQCHHRPPASILGELRRDGAGVRFRFRDLPKSMLFSLNFVRGRLYRKRIQSTPS